MESRLIYYDRYVVYSDGTVKSVVTGKFLSPGRQTKGYMTVALYDGTRPKKSKSFLLHRLIAEAFLGESHGRQVNHKNGDKSDNRVENLEWSTCAENNRHAREVLGKTQVGERNSRCKIPSNKVEEILKNDRSAKEWASELGCTADYVRQIRRGVYRSRG